LELAALAAAVAAPCIWLALGQQAGSVWAFAAWMLPGCMLLYVYYSGVYAAIQDVVEPALRGTAMSVYFFAMYLLGGAVGPVITGALTDHFAQQARLTEGVDLLSDQHRAVGLHQAMYVIPLLCAGLVVVLFAGSRTVSADHSRLQRWMEEGNPGGPG
jgi:MFS family permease